MPLKPKTVKQLRFYLCSKNFLEVWNMIVIKYKPPFQHQQMICRFMSFNL